MEDTFANKKVFPSIAVNLDAVKVIYNTMINSDIVVREFILNARNRQYKAFLLYIDGMVDSKVINDFILNPLMLRNSANSFSGDTTRVVSQAVTNNITVRKIQKFNITDYISNCLLPQNRVKQVAEFKDIVNSVNSGNCALFVDTLSIVFDIEVKGFKQRSISPPSNEIIIRGSQESFNEVIRTNTGLLRRLVNNENLIIENIEVGKLSRTKCAVCYLNNVANNDLVADVKFRLNNLEIDYLISSGQLEQLIEDNGNSSLPQVVATERPDKTANFLLEGRVAIIVNGSPYVLVVPGVLMDFLSSPEDLNLKFQFTNLLKFVRILAFSIALLLPGLYVAVTNFHYELLPTELLFAIVSSREIVPLPIIYEIVIMEISFELLREASLRVPSAIGPTIGIIGALILGQAAVEASIVSPILIIVIALTGIASFAIPDFSLSFHCRIARFAYIFLGYFLGFSGIALGIFAHLLILCRASSFGVNYLAPFLPLDAKENGLFMPPMWKREDRKWFLHTKRPKKEEPISMKWKLFEKERSG